MALAKRARRLRGQVLVREVFKRAHTHFQGHTRGMKRECVPAAQGGSQTAPLREKERDEERQRERAAATGARIIPKMAKQYVVTTTSTKIHSTPEKARKSAEASERSFLTRVRMRDTRRMRRMLATCATGHRTRGGNAQTCTCTCTCTSTSTRGACAHARRLAHAHV